MFQKKIPLKSHTNLAKVRAMRCFKCNKGPPSDPHHIKSRGAGGGDELSNLVALCRACHTKIHSLGFKKFMGDK